MKKRIRIKLGDVFAIPLPNSKFAFGRRFHDAGIAIYKDMGKNIDDLPLTEDYQFIVGVYDDVLKSGLWPIVDNRPFKNENDSWPPKSFQKDIFNGNYSIYFKGEFYPSTEEECEGLEEAAVWEGEHIVDRIMGDDKWHT